MKILSFLDDHSRVALRVKAVPEATTEATWDAFGEASAAWGVPLGQLTDNGLNFSGRLRGFEVHFETSCERSASCPRPAGRYHPQTCGKVERFQQTLKKWLRRQRLAADLAELQAQLDAFVDYYNHHRPHRGIGRHHARRAVGGDPTGDQPRHRPAQPRPDRTAVVVDNGVVNVGRYRIAIGSQWRGRTARVHHDDTHAAVFIDHQPRPRPPTRPHPPLPALRTPPPTPTHT